MFQLVLSLKPAYGRDYKSKAEVESAWNSNKDFSNHTAGVRGKYINKSDAEAFGIKGVNIRYQNLNKVHSIKVGG